MADGPRAETDCSAIVSVAGWTRIPSPEFPAGKRVIVDHAFEPNGTAVLVSNHLTMMLSRDTGCNWTSVLDVGDDPTLTGMRLRTIEWNHAKPREVLALLEGNGRFTVFRSADGGESWEKQLAQGAIGVGMPVDMAFSRDGDTAYLLVAAMDQLMPPILYVSRNRGSWTLVPHAPTDYGLLEGGRGYPGDTPEPARVRDLAVGAHAEELWLATSSSSSLLHSVNGGQSWKPASDSGLNSQQFGLVATNFRTVITLNEKGPGGYLSRNRGDNWVEVPTPGNSAPDSVAYAPGSGFVITVPGDGGGVFAAGFPVRSWVELPRVGEALSKLKVTPRFDRSYVSAAGTQHVYRRPASITGLTTSALPPGSAFHSSCPRLNEDVPTATPPQSGHGTRLEPSSGEMWMTVGDTKTHPYQLTLPSRTIPVDIFFLVDESGSMGPLLCGLRHSLFGTSSLLVESGFDVQFGLGEYVDFERNLPYRRTRDIGPLDENLIAAFNGIEERGGGLETQLIALFQAATGIGDTEYEPHIPPGQQVNFRPGAIRIIVHLTDEEYSIYPREPKLGQVGRALRKQAIRHITITDDSKPTYRALDHYRFMSWFTGALAPSSGLDCDGDSVPDISEGSPLVCQVDLEGSSDSFLTGPGQAEPVDLVPAITAMTAALAETHRVSLTPRTGQQVVRDVTPAHHVVDIQQKNRLSYAVEYHCDRGSVGRHFVVLEAILRAQVLADATMTVHCVQPPPPSFESQNLGAVVPLLPGPPPTAAHGPQTQTNPHPQPRVEQQGQQQSQQQAQAQAAAVAQRQQQPQMALVHSAQQLKDQISAQNAMVRAVQQRSDPLAAAKFGLAMSALSMILVYGLATATLRRAFAGRE